jgi:hypothetical protein
MGSCTASDVWRVKVVVVTPEWAGESVVSLGRTCERATFDRFSWHKRWALYLDPKENDET